MTPQELKNSILQLAIQGKLVEQNENDTPVDLSGIKPRKIDDFEFELPENWELAHLESITNGITSRQHQILESEVQEAGNYPVISQSKAYSIGFTDKSEKVFHHDRPVVIFGDHTAEVKYVKFDFVVGADGVKIFEPIYEILTAEFLFYVLQFYSKDLSKVGGYSRHYKFIKNKPIPIPPLAEQKRIVTKIEELLPYINCYEQAWSRLEDFNKRFSDDMKKSILQLAIQGRLVEQRSEEGTADELYQRIQKEKRQLIKAGKIKKEKPLPEITEDEMPFEIPKSWKWVRIQQIGELNRGRSQKRPRNDPKLFINGTFPFIQTGDVARANQYITDWTTMYNEEGVAQSRVWPKGTVCLTIAANIGDVAILGFDSCFPDSVVGFNAYAPVDSNEFFMYGLMCYKSILDKKSRATAQKNINLDILSQIPFPLPPLAEQKRIVARLEELLPLCERLK